MLFGDSPSKVNYPGDFDEAVTDLTKVRGRVVELRSTIRTHARLQITSRPHPYLLHANDCGRAYLLSRIKSIDPDTEVINDPNYAVVYSPHPGVGV